MSQKEPSGGTISYGQEWARKSHQDPAVRFVTSKSPRVGQKKPPRPGSTICYVQESKNGPERATKTQQYDLLRPRVGQKKPPRPRHTIYYDQEWTRKTPQDPAVRFDSTNTGPERAPTTRQYDLLWPRVGQKKPARPTDYDQDWTRKSH